MKLKLLFVFLLPFLCVAQIPAYYSSIDFSKTGDNHAVIELYQNQSYKLIGMPFYNKEHRESVFKDSLSNL
jgi:hypothetical protein